MIQCFLAIKKEKNLILVIQFVKYFRQKILIVGIIFNNDDWAVFINNDVFFGSFI
jgi:hypothetical protein